MTRFLKLIPLFAALAAGGCAPKDWDAEYDGAYDPLEALNRKTYNLNKGLDKVLLKPAARVYILLPSAGRAAVGRFFDNLEEPVSAANNLLQVKPARFAQSASRFAINSSIGVLGFFDPASAMDIEPAEEDFGQTLRHYGWSQPPYLVLPLLGPSSLADAAGTAADFFIPTPEDLLTDGAQIGVGVLNGIHIRSEFLDATEMAEEALDEYAFVRDIYEDARQTAVRDGAEKEEDDEDDY